MRIRRSIDWSKGFSEETVKNSIATAADAVCIDLEDGVPPARKAEARVTTVHALNTLDFRGKERIVRVNAIGSEDFYKDIAEVIAVATPDAIRVPKCEYVKDMLMIDGLLNQIEQSKGLAPNSIEVIAMIESPIGIRNAFDIASCCERVTALNVGMEDLTRGMGVVRRYEDNELDLVYARQKMVLDAKAAGVQAIDSGLLVPDPEKNFKQNADSRQMGFTGRSVHGNAEAENANKAFAPSEADIAFAKGAVAAYKEGKFNKDGNVVFNGKTICFAAYEKALDVLAYDELLKSQK